MFEQLKLKRIYRTKYENVDSEFFIPVIQRSRVYDRGTGYFSIEGLSALSKGIVPYIRNGGLIRIVTSVELDEKEINAIRQGYEIAKNVIIEEINNTINNKINDDNVAFDMDLITNLIASGKLQIKIAYLPDGGIYHEKIGYFEDDQSNSIWFIGSNNETFSGLKKNVESFSVFKSWDGDFEDIQDQKKYFNELWDDRDDEIRTFSFPEAEKEKLFSLYKRSSNLEEAITSFEDHFNNGSTKDLYDYQKEAIHQFVENGYCHFFEMATGTGKTFTAVKAIQRLSNDLDKESLYVIVVVPQVDLQDQWKKEFDDCGIQTYLFGGNSINKDWDAELSKSIIDYFNGEKLVVSICIYDTYFSKIYSEIDGKKMNKMIVVDEAHELSANQIKKLSNKFSYRLGLSATPERHSKQETESIINYFTLKKTDTFKYTIEDAIENDYLSRYEYHPIKVFMEDDDLEFRLYQQLTKKYIALMNEEEPDQQKIQETLNNRSLVIKKARNKPIKLGEMLESNEYDFINSVIYCGQGKDVETDETIIDNVTLQLKTKGKLRVSQFTSKTIDRQKVLREFENGYYDTLVAIKCFDQGVDVPKLDKIYIMASDSLLRQTIQRRGRVLRKCKETGKSLAHIYDMITLPPEGIYSGIGAASLAAKELKRVKEYARLAENKGENDRFINSIINDYSITEESDDEKETDN